MVEGMGREAVAHSQGAIGQVGNCLGCCAKGGWRIFPTHWQNQWQRHKWLLAKLSWENHAQARYILWVDINAVKPIGDVNFEHENGPMGWVCEQDVAKDARECLSKLHDTVSHQR
jgi:hypothetical protein